MAVDQSARLDERDRRQRAVLRCRVYRLAVSWICAVRISGVRHDRGVVLERIADVAVLVGVRADGPVVELVGVGDVVVPLIAVVLPGDVVREQVVADAGGRGGRNGEHRVVRVRVGVGVVAVAEVAGVVVVEQVVVARFAVRVDRTRQRCR